MTDPQVYVLESSDDGPFYPPPSVERQKEVLALWRRFCTSDPEHLSIFWWFIRALDAQHAERTRAEVEKMRGRAARCVGALPDVPSVDRLLKAIEASILALSIEGKSTHLHIKSGHEVTVVAQGRMQSASLIGDMTEVTIYQHEGRWWVRPTTEFNDGRFRPLSTEGTGQ